MKHELLAPIKTEEQKLNFCEETIGMNVNLSMGYILLAKRLHAIRAEKLYEPQWSSFMEFAMEMKDIAYTKVSRLCSVYQKYVIDLQIPEEEVAKVGWTILDRARRVIKTREEAMQFIESPLTRSDLEKEITEKETGKDMTQCKHEDTYLVRVCRECKDKWEEFEEKRKEKHEALEKLYNNEAQ